MPIIIEKIDMPSECHGCIFEDRVGGCIILNKTGACGKSYEEYDDEWFKAHNEHRRLKWCPLKESREYDFSDVKKLKSDFITKESFAFQNYTDMLIAMLLGEEKAGTVHCSECKYLEISGCYGECGKAYRGIVNPDDHCEHGKRRKE